MPLDKEVGRTSKDVKKCENANQKRSLEMVSGGLMAPEEPDSRASKHRKKMTPKPG